MKKIFSMILSLGILINSSGCAFACKSDPLDPYVDEIRKEFEAKERKYRNPDYPCMWEKKPSFILFNDDYRTVRVYNIPHLLREYSHQHKNSFLRTYAKALMDTMKALKFTNKLAKNSEEAARKYFTEEISKLLKDKGYAKEIANFLGTDDETAIGSYIASTILISDSKILGAMVETSLVAINAFNILQPLFLPALVVAPQAAIAITVAHNLLNILRMCKTKSAFETERIANYALVLSLVNRILLENPQEVLESNLLATAVDERNFYSPLIWNSFPGRRNDGAWAHFVNIGDLKCAPLAKEYREGEVVPRYINLFRQIMTNGNLNLEKVQDYLDGNVMIIAPMPQLQLKDKKEVKVKVEEVA